MNAMNRARTEKYFSLGAKLAIHPLGNKIIIKENVTQSFVLNLLILSENPIKYVTNPIIAHVVEHI